jgi:hypothetical protein
MCGVSTINSDDNKMKNIIIILTVLIIATSTTKAQSKYVLLEELTGSWCQYCPGGTYYVDSLTKVYSHFIGVAIHTNDDMGNTVYSSACGLTGAPTANIDRGGQAAGINKWFSDVASALNIPPAAGIGVFTNFNSSTRLLTVRVESSFTSAVSGNYRLAAIITEDGVTGPSPQYDQNNYIYSGGGNGVMGGYEVLPPTIPAYMIAYNHVGRELLGGYNGQPGSVPSTVLAGDTASYVFNYTIPATWKAEYIRVIGLLIKPDNSIDNAGISSYLDGNDNAKPLFISQPVTTASVGSPYVFDVYSADPDNDNLTMTALNLPSWISMSPQSNLGMIHTKVSLSGTPGNTGNYPVEIMVSDGSRSDTLNYTITVNSGFAGSWVLVGAQGFTNTDHNLGIVADKNGVLYAFIDYIGFCNVYQKTSSGGWINCGNLNGTGNVGHIRIGSDGLTPYVAYCYPPSKVSVYKYTSGAWTPIGDFPAGGVVQFGFDLDANDNPYIACQNVNDGSKGCCYAYNGTDWLKLGNVAYSGNAVSVCNDLVVNKSNGKVNVLWSNYSNGNVPIVSEWNGSSWFILGGTSITNNPVKYFQNIVINEETQQLYTAHARNSAGNVYLDAYTYNGTSWESIGADIANGQVNEPKMTINDAGALLIAFVDFNHSSSVSAMSYVNGNWNYIGPSGFSNALSSNCAVTSYRNIPYVMYRDGAAENKSTVRCYNSLVSVDELPNTISTFKISPNPAKDIITVHVNENHNGRGVLSIYNIIGSLIKTETLYKNQQSIHVNDLYNGLYFVTIKSNESTQNQKLIIQR